MTTNHANPDESIYQLSSYDRALGRFVEIPRQEGEDGKEFTQTESDLLGDSFWSYFADKEGRKEIPETRDINKRLLDWSKESPNWSNNQTSGNILASAYAGSLLHNALLNDPSIAEAMKKEQEAEELKKEAEAEAEASQALQEAGQEAEAGKMRESSRQKMEAFKQTLQEAEAGIDKLQNSKMGNAIRASAVKQAGEEGEKISAICKSWGLEQGSGNVLDASTIKETLDKYREILPIIGSLLGRVKGIASSVKSKKVKPSDIITGDGYTRELTRIFPGEISLLRKEVNPVIRAVKMGEYADRGLIGMVTGTTGETEGGIILIRDGSGSMEGNPNNKASALCLGILEVARETGQEAEAFTFSSRGQVIPLDGNPSFEDKVKWCVNIPSGGTDFDYAMGYAMDLLEGKGEEVLQSSDMVIITDGYGDINMQTVTRLNQFREDYGTRLIYIAVGSDIGIGGRFQSTVDKTMNLTDEIPLESLAEEVSRFLWE